MRVETIELRNLKLSVARSEESPCFSATVYCNGRRAFTVANSGEGGANVYGTLGDVESVLWLDAARHYARRLPPAGELAMDLDQLIVELLFRWEILKLTRKNTRLCYAPHGMDGRCLTTQLPPTEENRQRILLHVPDAQILNDLLLGEVKPIHRARIAVPSGNAGLPN
jgi:hypothetical protein